MKESIFRKKSIDKISSPEQLNEYIRVANPSIFLILIAIVVLLVGIFVWGIFGTLETSVKFVAVVESGNATIYAEEDIIEMSEIFDVEDKKIEIDKVHPVPMSSANLDPYAIHLLGVSSNTFLYYGSGGTILKDGIYSGEIVTESVNPISFITN